MSRPEPWVSIYSPGHVDECVNAVIEYLSDWYGALQDGSAVYRLPDPAYQRSHGRHPWTDADLDRLIDAIEEEYGKELRNWAQYTRSGPGDSSRHNGLGCDAGPGFTRLEPAQRLAFAQGLDALLQEYAGRYSQRYEKVQIIAGGRTAQLTWDHIARQAEVTGAVATTFRAASYEAAQQTVRSLLAQLPAL